MNRRGFMAALLAGVVAPAFLPGAGRKWVQQQSGVWTINPDWVNAPFELQDVWNTPVLGMPITYLDPYPRRFRKADGTQEITPFIFV